MVDTPRSALTTLLQEALALGQQNHTLLDVVEKRLAIIEAMLYQADDGESLLQRTAVQERRVQELEGWQRRLEDRQGVLSAAQMQAGAQIHAAQVQAGATVSVGRMTVIAAIVSAVMGCAGVLLGLWLKGASP